jgi:nickel transport protein
MRKICLLFIALALGFGHKVNIFAYVSGDKIFLEGYASDGAPVKNGAIEVFDKTNHKLLECILDDEGKGSFKVPVRTDLRIVLNASMGHRAETVIGEEDLPTIAMVVPEKTKVLEKKTKEVKPTECSIDTCQIKDIVETIIDKKLQPIMRKLTLLQERKVTLTDVLGGIGYILGLMGIIMYFRSRQRRG